MSLLYNLVQNLLFLDCKGCDHAYLVSCLSMIFQNILVTIFPSANAQRFLCPLIQVLASICFISSKSTCQTVDKPICGLGYGEEWDNNYFFYFKIRLLLTFKKRS